MKSALLSLLVVLGSLNATALAADPFAVSGITFKPGDDWTSKKPSSSMRAAELEITPEGADKPLTAVFYYFGAGQGGGVDANIQRWIGQFEGTPEQETKEHAVGDKKITVLHARGTYMESMGGPFAGPKTPRADYAMLGAIVPGNDSFVYIKLTGPKAEVEKIQAKFLAMAKSPFGE